MRKNTLILIAVLLVGGIAGGYWLGRSPAQASDTVADTPATTVSVSQPQPGTASAQPSKAVRYQEALEAGKAALADGNAAEAFRRLQTAVGLDAGSSEVHYQLAVATYLLGDLDQADKHAADALQRDTGEAAERIREVQGFIAKKREFMRHERAADEAFADARFAKAADSYRAAYLLFPAQGRLGLQAGRLYLEKLDRPLEAARLWHKVAAEADAESRTAALEELARHRDKLDAVFSRQLAAAVQSGAAKGFADLVDAFPRRVEARVEQAAAAAIRGDLDETHASLKAAVRMGYGAKELGDRDEFLAAIEDPSIGPSLQLLISDAFGQQVVRQMRSEWQRREAKRFADQRAREEAERKERESRRPAVLNAEREKTLQRINAVLAKNWDPENQRQRYNIGSEWENTQVYRWRSAISFDSQEQSYVIKNTYEHITRYSFRGAPADTHDVYETLSGGLKLTKMTSITPRPPSSEMPVPEKSERQVYRPLATLLIAVSDALFVEHVRWVKVNLRTGSQDRGENPAVKKKIENQPTA
jgi:hypothetical protein